MLRPETSFFRSSGCRVSIAERKWCYNRSMTNPLERWNDWLGVRRANLADATVNIRRAFVLVWQSHPRSAMAMLGCTLVGSFLPSSQAWIGKLIVDAVVNAVAA